MGFILSTVSFLLGFLIGLIFVIIGWPKKRTKPEGSELAENPYDRYELVSESADWINRLLSQAFKEINLQERLPGILQAKFDEKFSVSKSSFLAGIQVRRAEISADPPAINSITTKINYGRVDSTFAFDYTSELYLDLDITINISLINKKTTINAKMAVHRVRGSFSVFVPTEFAPLIIKVNKGTKVDFDIGEKSDGQSKIGKEIMTKVWHAARDFIVSTICGMEFPIQLLPDPDDDVLFDSVIDPQRVYEIE